MSIDAITFNNSCSWKIAYWSVNDLSRGAIGSKNTYTVPLLYQKGFENIFCWIFINMLHEKNLPMVNDHVIMFVC